MNRPKEQVYTIAPNGPVIGIFFEGMKPNFEDFEFPKGPVVHTSNQSGYFIRIPRHEHDKQYKEHREGKTFFEIRESYETRKKNKQKRIDEGTRYLLYNKIQHDLYA